MASALWNDDFKISPYIDISLGFHSNLGESSCFHPRSDSGCGWGNTWCPVHIYQPEDCKREEEAARRHRQLSQV